MSRLHAQKLSVGYCDGIKPNRYDPEGCINIKNLSPPTVVPLKVKLQADRIPHEESRKLQLNCRRSGHVGDFHKTEHCYPLFLVAFGWSFGVECYVLGSYTGTQGNLNMLETFGNNRKCAWSRRSRGSSLITSRPKSSCRQDDTEAQVVSRVTSLTIQSVSELRGDLISYQGSYDHTSYTQSSRCSTINKNNCIPQTHGLAYSRINQSRFTTNHSEGRVQTTSDDREEASSISPLDSLIELNPIGAAELSCSLEESSSVGFSSNKGPHSIRPVGQSKVLNGAA